MILFLTKNTPSSIKQIEGLRKINYQVIHSPLPVEAFSLSRREREIKLILVDIDSVPDFLPFINEISHYIDLPILYTTLQEEEVVNRKNLSQHFHGYLSKGAESFDLKHTISTTMTLFYSNRKMKNELSCLQLAERISNFGYWTLNLPEGTVYLSEGTKKIYGLSENRSSIDYLQDFPLPKYRDMLDTSLKDLIQGKLPYDVEFKIKNKVTGRIIPIHSVALYDPIGNTITGILYDISKQKKSEERALRREEECREIIQNHNAVMLIMDSETGNILMANSSACRFYGWKREEITQMAIHQINTLSREEVRERMKSARSQKNNVFSFKHRLADGKIRDVQVFSAPITYEDKGCLFSVIHDVTDREKTYKQIEHQAYYDSITVFQTGRDSLKP